MAESNQERLRKLYKENNLSQEDTFIMERGGKKIPIITRSGIEKIQANNGIHVKYELVYHSEDLKTCVIKAMASMGSNYIETFAEANPANCKNEYPIMTCEKRAMGRAVLKLARFYELGVFSEGENLDPDGVDR